ncbi:phospholipase D family protein [Ralstonia mannitolilytica]|uniref:phospholipase D family protein n=1 Tax=Ralstonia mannitolilytica TaxID=105219 RepID=UPI0005D8F32C|nr:phospholipase D family protein [Ralstonia mannitolilytica]AJW47199.1 phospholipase D [Ralstonia mannitolilytica]QIF09545.1 phospholipase D family protein [Ralstonia mannitolilytica]CAJ0732818.1 Cardiolipin synthase C [Ralstonia mannitolilytica]CAJ0789781.1 Cardiolipin synthase C [Ralstonia mannitolilytica]
MQPLPRLLVQHSRGWFAWLVVLLAACASLPDHVDRPVTTALAAPAPATSLGRLVQANAPSPDVSGFRLIASGEEAYATLLTLADRAERTLDLQYFIIESDNSVRELMRHVLAAAERGVRVRMLVDDLHSDGRDVAFLKFSSHKNIDVRLFNPFPGGRMSNVTRYLSGAAEFRRVNRRMHNKAFIADNALAVTGGRNLGAEYFTQDKNTNFVDLDVLAAGPAVRQLSAAFDSYWNSEFAYPVQALAPEPSNAHPPEQKDGNYPPPVPAARTPEGPPRHIDVPTAPLDFGSGPQESARSVADVEQQRMRNETDLAHPTPTEPLPLRPALRDWFLADQIARRRLRLEWVPAQVIVDRPAKVSGEKVEPGGERLAQTLLHLIDEAKSEVALISPYFVPGKAGVDVIRHLRERGVRLRVLTNSLAATDAPIVHVGYAKYRSALLDSGVELYELRPTLGDRPKAVGSFRSSQASLHVKSIIIDRNTLFVGSMNIDPRSIALNTETGLIIRSPVLAQAVAKLFDDSIGDSAYRVTQVDGHLRWTTHQNGKEVSVDHEPDVGFGRRAWIQMLAPFTPEELL